MRSYVWLALGCAFSGGVVMAAPTSEAKVRAAVERLSPGSKIEAISAAPVAGMFEVIVDGKELYVTADGSHLFSGSLWQVDKRINLTEASRSERRVRELPAYGAEHRIVFAAENPQHRVTVFTDIDCGYCRKLHESVAAYNQAGISVEYILFPRGGLNSPSFDSAVSVWCADDNREALTLAKRGQPVSPKICENPVGEGFKLGLRIGVNSTPTIVTDSGKLMLGFVPPDQLLAQLTAGK